MNPNKWRTTYIIIILYLSIFFNYFNDKYSSVLIQKAVNIIEENYLSSNIELNHIYTTFNMILSGINNKNLRAKEAIIFGEKALEILKLLCKKNQNRWEYDYVYSLNYLSNPYMAIDIEKAISLKKEVLSYLKNLYNKNKIKYATLYIKVLIELGELYNHNAQLIELKDDSSERNKDVLYRYVATKESNLLFKSALDAILEYSNFTKIYEPWLIEYYIKILMELSCMMRNENNIQLSIELKNRVLDTIKKLFNQDREKWSDLYIQTLSEIVSVYSETIDKNEKMYIYNELLETMNILYKNDNTKWARKYFYLLDMAISFYYDINKDNSAILLKKYRLNMLEKLYYNNGKEEWGELYLDAINSLLFNDKYYFEKKFIVIKELFKLDCSAWVKQYVDFLTSAFGYIDILGEKKANSYLKAGIKIAKLFYNKDKEIWTELYYNALKQKSNYYILQNNEKIRDIDLEEEIVNLAKYLYQNNPDKWHFEYIQDLNSLAFLYQNSGLLDKAIELQEESLRLIKYKYNDDQDFLFEDYQMIVENLANNYLQSGKSEEEIEELLGQDLEEVGLEISDEETDEYEENNYNGYMGHMLDKYIK